MWLRRHFGSRNHTDSQMDGNAIANACGLAISFFAGAFVEQVSAWWQRKPVHGDSASAIASLESRLRSALEASRSAVPVSFVWQLLVVTLTLGIALGYFVGLYCSVRYQAPRQPALKSVPLSGSKALPSPSSAVDGQSTATHTNLSPRSSITGDAGESHIEIDLATHVPTRLRKKLNKQ